MRNHKSLVQTKSSHSKKTTANQTSMKSIISNFTMYFSYSDENGDHKSLVETKPSHLRKITTVR